MILDQLANADTYRFLGPSFEQAFAYLKSFSPATPDGRHNLNGDRLYALVQSYNTAPATERTFEAHRQYADVQYIVDGRETIYYNHVSVLEPKTEYDPKTDATFYHDQDNRPFHLGRGDFMIFLPQDAHKPSCLWGETSPVRKVVIKLLL